LASLHIFLENKPLWKVSEFEFLMDL